jgi:nitroreductase
VITDIDESTVRKAVALASRAPSIHNSQPWRWVLGPRTIRLDADLRRWLPVTDVDRRDLVVSLGAALHHLRVALAAAGIGATVRRFPDPESPDHAAGVELSAAAPPDADAGLAAAITRRRTDRRRFTDWEVPTGFLEELMGSAALQGALARPVAAAGAQARLVDAIRAAAQAQEQQPGYRAETARWSGRSSGSAGIPAANLLRDPVGTGGGTARDFGEGLIEQPATGEPDGAVLLVIGTASDDPLSQLRAGEALSAVLLHATELGLATCPLTQPLEVGTTRRMLRDEVLGGTLSPQVVVRVGWAPAGPAIPETPRLPVDETIERLPAE